jgi:hypothetical protein
MSSEALPLTLLIVLTEITVGGMWALVFWQQRDNAALSFIKFSAAMVFVMAAITFFAGAAISIEDEVGGYPLDNGWATGVRVALAALFAVCGLYAYATLRDHRQVAVGLGAGGGLLGVLALAFLGLIAAGPTWGFALTFAVLLLGAATAGTVSLSMTLGHWYLVTPRLPGAPLREMTGLLVALIVLQAVIILPALVLPRDDVMTTVDTPLLENPFFWLRVGFGLVFPGVLAWMAFDSSGVRAMQSATGLLYIAMVLVICGEVVGKGLLFVSAIPN